MVFRLAHNGTPSAAEEGKSPCWIAFDGDEENSDAAKEIHAMRANVYNHLKGQNLPAREAGPEYVMVYKGVVEKRNEALPR